MPKILEVLTDKEFTDMQDKNEIAISRYDVIPKDLQDRKILLDTIEYLRLTGRLAQPTLPEVRAYLRGE